jgi:lysophospholipase L1-like esterase
VKVLNFDKYESEITSVPIIDEISNLAPNNLQGDGSHLTPEGYHIAAEKLLPLVEQLIMKRRQH